MKTHPKIESISASTGYTTGGQTLEINGWGLKGTTLADVSVTVDGVACTVTNSTLDKITCTTGAASAVSYEGDQPGTHGLRQLVYDPTNADTNPGWNSYNDGTPLVETRLLTAWDDAFGNYTRALTHAKGWFKAPEAGRYRFYLACDDFCKTEISNEKFDKTKTDAYTMTRTNIRHWATRWRHYNFPQETGHSNTWTSDWITLEKDAFYKVDGFHGEYSGGDHSTVSVEFEKTGTTGMHHASKEVQLLEVKNEIVYEQFNITVKNAHGGKYQIMFVNPKYDASDRNSPKTVLTREITDNTDVNSVRRAVRDFYGNWRIWSSDLEVTKHSTDDNFETQTDESLIT